jgi:hypothetical protein
MPTHLYCLLPAASELAPPPGVRVLAAPGLVAWVADTPELRLPRDARDAARATLGHDRVVGAALAQGTTPVPASLADAFPDDDAVAADLARHVGAIQAAMTEVQGRVEMTTIVAMNDSTPIDGVEGRGRAYLEQLRDQPSRASAVADRIAHAMRGLAGPERRRLNGGRAALSHLIVKADIDRYRQAALGQAGEGYRIVIDGPRAPYSFASFSPRRGMILAS